MHEQTEMKFDHYFNRKHTYQTGRRGNIWYILYKCPVCGLTKRRLKNLRKPTPKCDGTT